MYQEFPHQPIEREEGEFVCARCGLLNPGEEDGCITVLSETSTANPVPKAA